MHDGSQARVCPRCTGADHAGVDLANEPIGGFGPDEAEQQAEAEDLQRGDQDDYDMEEALEEEEENATLGGDQFTPEQITVAEAAFNGSQVRMRHL